MFFNIFRAFFTFNFAAPFKLAVTVLLNSTHLRRVAPPTTHQRTPVKSITRHVTHPALRSHDPLLRVVLAVAGRAVQVHEVAVRRSLHVSFNWSEFEFAAMLLHVTCSVELVLEDFADFVEVWHCAPTDLHLARRRHSVALAAQTNVVAYSLQRTEQPRSITTHLPSVGFTDYISMF